MLAACRTVNDITSDVGLPHQHGSDSTTYQHGNPLFVTHDTGSFEEEARAAQIRASPGLESSEAAGHPQPVVLNNAGFNQASMGPVPVHPSNSIHTLPAQAAWGPLTDTHDPNMSLAEGNRNTPPVVSHVGLMLHQQPDPDARSRLSPAPVAKQAPVSGIQPAATVTGVADLYRSQNPQHIASSNASRFVSSPQADIRPAATYQDQSTASSTLLSHPVSQRAFPSQAIPRSSSPRGVADLYQRGGSSFGPAGGPSSSSSKRSRGRPSQPTASSDSQGHSGSRSRSRDHNRRQALGISSSEITGSRAGSSFRSESIAEVPGARPHGNSQPEGEFRRSSGTRRSGSREGWDRSDMGPSEPRLASISVNRRSAEGRLRPQQELSPRSHARQVDSQSGFRYIFGGFNTFKAQNHVPIVLCDSIMS